MFEVRQENGSPFFTGIFQAPDGKNREYSTKSVIRSVAQQIVMCWVLLSLAARNRIMTKRQYMEVAKTLYYIATGTKIPNITVREAVKLFMNESGQKDDETVKSRRYAMSSFIQFLGVEADGIIEDVAPAHILRYRDSLLKKSEPSTANNRLEVLSTFFNFALRMGWVEKNPVVGVKVKDPNAHKKSKVIRRPFRRREAFLLVEKADVEMTGFFITDFHLGARQGDVSCISVPKMADFAEDEGVDMEFFNDKGEKDMTLPTLPEYGLFISEFLKHHPNPQPGEKLFWEMGPKPKKARTSYVTNTFDDICQAQGLRDAKTAPIGKSGKRQYELVPHCIRHTVNMALKLGDMPPALVCVFLGHTADANRRYDHFQEMELMRQELFKAAGKKSKAKKPTWMTIQDILDLTTYATEKLRRIRMSLPALSLEEAEAFLAARKVVSGPARNEDGAVS